MTSVFDLLRKHEGYSTTRYQDSRGFWTIGIGHCLDKNPLPAELFEPDGSLSDATISEIFDDDIGEITGQINSSLPWTLNMDPVRLAVLQDIGFECGITGLMAFRTFLGLMQSGDYAGAAQDLQTQTLLAKQVPSREAENAQMLISGEWPSDSKPG